MLAADWDVAADVWSVTSWSELNRDGVDDREGKAAPPRPPGASALRHPGARRHARPGGRRLRLDARRAGPDPAVGAQHLRHAGHRRLRLLRHPARPRAATSTSTPSRWWWRCWRRWPATGRSTSRSPSRPPSQYRIDDVLAAPEQTSDPGVRLTGPLPAAPAWRNPPEKWRSF